MCLWFASKASYTHLSITCPAMPQSSTWESSRLTSYTRGLLATLRNVSQAFGKCALQVACTAQLLSIQKGSETHSPLEEPEGIGADSGGEVLGLVHVVHSEKPEGHRYTVSKVCIMPSCHSKLS